MNNTRQDNILSDIKRIEKGADLYQEKNFILRQQAIDYIEFHIIDRINALTESTAVSDRMNALKQYAEKVKSRLVDVDTSMFHKLRTKISLANDKGKLLTTLFDEYLDYPVSASIQQDDIGYDDLDVFVNGLLTTQALPAETKDREPEMVFYQKTPARIILELIKRAEFKPQDIFFDLGSGLGQVVILVSLLTSVSSKGIEFEPSFCSYAKDCASGLNLPNVDFINTDARYADYSTGTIFFMYTPFEGKMLQEVLQNLKAGTQKRKIKIFTYGPCTMQVAQQDWLINRSEAQNCLDKLGAFISA